MDFTRTSTARVATDRPARYGKQLVGHMGHKITASWDAEAGRGAMTFDREGPATGEVTLTCEPGVLTFELRTDDAHLDGLEGVIGRHLVRFGAKDELVVAWTRDDGQPGTVQDGSGEPA